MDWEKKTAAREFLREAAKDTFNNMSTPGQALLKSLQDSEVVRKAQFFGTVSAKMKAAREQLPSLGVKHAPRSENTIFCRPPAAEVHSLLPNVHPEKSNMVAVAGMLEAKLGRHRAALDIFVGVRDGARQELEATIATSASGLRSALAEDDESIESLMLALDEEHIMRLTEPEVREVWDAVAQRIPERTAWIEELAAELEAAEEARRARVEAALVQMVSAMTDVSVLSEGEVERLLEREALALNTAILFNRRAYADLCARLGVAEVEAEQSRRTRWEASLEAWRMLRSRHAMDMFNERIRSAEFAEPPQRLALFEAVRSWQAQTSTQISCHVEAIPLLLPPHTTARRVAAWRSDAARIFTTWLQGVTTWDSKLLAHDAELETQGWAAYEALRLEVRGYGGYPEEQAAAMLDEGCASTLRTRRGAALQVCEAAKVYMQWQAARWQDFTDVLGAWLADLAVLFEEHKAATSVNEGAVRATLKSQRELYNHEDSAREVALDAGIASVQQGASERELDQQVAVALGRLEDIERGYREFATAMALVVRSFPRTVTEANDKYHWYMCTCIHVKPLVETPLSEIPTPPPSEPEPEPEPVGTAPVPPPKKGVKGKQPVDTPPPPPPRPKPEPVPEPEPQPIKELTLPDGTDFYIMSDLANELFRLAKQKEQTAALEAAQLLSPPLIEPAPDVLAPALAAELPGKMPKSKAAGPKAGAKDKSAALELSPTLEVAVVVAPPPKVPEVLPPPESPLSHSGRAHCRQLQLPMTRFQVLLETMQVGLLKEMVEFAMRTVSTADQWADERETSLTEELDAHLRAHRPRAGRIEEETRLARSVELVAQRRRIEGHLRAQSKAVKAQAAQFDDWASGLQTQVLRQITKLRSYDNYLGQALSVQAIDIRKREAHALRQRIERDLEARLTTLREGGEAEESVVASCARITSANQAFAAAELRSFERGGQYNPANVAQYRASLGAIDSHMAKAQAAQLEALQGARAALLAQGDEALANVTSLLPSHHEDVALIEVLDQLLDAAHKTSNRRLITSEEASAAIDNELANLEMLLAPPNSGGGRAALDVQPGSLAQCTAILTSMDALREQLYRQAKTLDFLRSTGLVIEPVDLTLDAAPMERSAFTPSGRSSQASSGPPHGGGVAFRPGSKDSSNTPATAAAAAAAAAAVKAGGARDKAGARPKSGQLPGGPPVQIPLGDPVSLARDIEAVIDTCKRDTEQAARAYYTALFPPDTGKGAKGGAAGKAPSKPIYDKGGKSGKPGLMSTEDDTPQPVRPIRYPQRIPPSIDTLLTKTDDVLGALRDQLGQHVATGVKQLRAQVIRAYRAVEHAPSMAMAALAAHELQAARKAQLAVSSRQRSRQAKLLAVIDQLRSTLHPSMAQPSGRAKLEELKERETERAAEFQALVAEYADEGVHGVEAAGPRIRTRLVQLVTILVRLLDNFLMPDDLPPIREDGEDDWVYALPGRKDDKQLFRLAAANAEAEGVVAADVPAPARVKSGRPGAAPPCPKSPVKGGKGVPAEGDSSVPPRPFGLLTWSLPMGQLDLASLGWSNDPGLPVVMPAQSATTTVAQPVAAKAGAKGAAAAAVVAAPTGIAITGMDTPCHRAGIRAYRASLAQVECTLCASQATLTTDLKTWITDEALWERTWGELISYLTST